MALLKQSTARNRVVLMVQSSDHVTGLAGLTLTITSSKNGAAFATITPTVTDLSNGFYNLALTTAHTDTLGDLALHITGTNADPTDILDEVVADLPGATVSSVTGSVNSVTTGVTVTTNNDKTGYALTSGEHTNIGTDVWGAAESSFTTAGTFGRALGSSTVRDGTCQAGSTSTTIVFDSGASATDNFYNGAIVAIISGTGAGQSRGIKSYVGSTKTATVWSSWATTPDNTSVFVIRPHAEAAASVWNAARSSFATSGTFGEGVASVQGNVTGSVASVTAGVTVTTNNDKTGYALTSSEHTNISGDVWSAALSSYTTAGTFGRAQNSAVLRDGTAQAGSTSSTLVLDSGASATNEFYTGGVAVIIGGTGAGQSRGIKSYTGSSKTATMCSNWATTPDNTSVFVIRSGADNAACVWNAARSGFAVSGSFGEGVASVQGSVTGSVASVTGNVGGNVVGSVASVTAAVSVTGDLSATMKTSVENAVWNASTSGHTSAGTFGLGVPVTGDLTATMKSSVKTQIDTSIGSDTIAELAQAVPAATPTLKTAVMLMYMALRNQLTTTASNVSYYNDAGTVICKSSISDDGTTFTRPKLVSGP